LSDQIHFLDFDNLSTIIYIDTPSCSLFFWALYTYRQEKQKKRKFCKFFSNWPFPGYHALRMHFVNKVKLHKFIKKFTIKLGSRGAGENQVLLGQHLFNPQVMKRDINADEGWFKMSGFIVTAKDLGETA